MPEPVTDQPIEEVPDTELTYLTEEELAQIDWPADPAVEGTAGLED